MSSYLSVILSSIEVMQISHITSKYPELVTSVDICKQDLLSYLENVYIRFIERPKQNKTLAKKIKQLQDDMLSIKSTAEQITRKELPEVEKELKTNLESLHQVDVFLSFISTVHNIHELLLEIEELAENQYLVCMEKILKTREMISSLDFDEDLEVLKELEKRLQFEEDNLIDHLHSVFKENVRFKTEGNKNVLQIKNKDQDVENVLLALSVRITSIEPLDNVTSFLWNNFFIPVVDYTTEIEFVSEDNSATMELIIVDSSKKSYYAEVFSKLKSILSFLQTNFNFNLNEEMSTLHYIGRDVKDNLSELIIKHCLQDTIPSTDEELQKYSVIVEATEDLEQALISAKMFTADTTSLLNYAKKIDILYIEKKCDKYKILAHELMKKDLHDMVEVGDARESLTSLEESEEFPRCCISRSVPSLLQLLEKILLEALSSSQDCACRLVTTVKVVCESYAFEVLEYHKKLLQTIPQQIALFYNNCIYISHELSKWNNKFFTKLFHIGNTQEFLTVQTKLSEVASEKFTSYVNSQIKQIQEIMKETGLQQKTLEQVESSTEKCLRQCLRQQELLRTVWHKVLPYTIYNNTLGMILDSLCSNIINSVVKLEDISTVAAEQLVELFKMIQTRGPKLFTDPKEVSLFVKNWYKLNELSFVLNASLIDINDRWADGKGPLALQFKPKELKQLVRALFQNTERRAAVLAKIHD